MRESDVRVGETYEIEGGGRARVLSKHADVAYVRIGDGRRGSERPRLDYVSYSKMKVSPSSGGSD